MVAKELLFQFPLFADCATDTVCWDSFVLDGPTGKFHQNNVWPTMHSAQFCGCLLHGVGNTASSLCYHTC